MATVILVLVQRLVNGRRSRLQYCCSCCYCWDDGSGNYQDEDHDHHDADEKTTTMPASTSAGQLPTCSIPRSVQSTRF